MVGLMGISDICRDDTEGGGEFVRFLKDAF